MLRIANYLAAPFGSQEYNLLNYGVEGVDYTMGANGPTLNATGTKYAGSSVTTYNFLASPNNTIYNAGYPAVTKASATWGQRNAKYGYQPLFYGLNVTVPNSLAAANAFTPFSSTTQHHVRGGPRPLHDRGLPVDAEHLAAERRHQAQGRSTRESTRSRRSRGSA